MRYLSLTLPDSAAPIFSQLRRCTNEQGGIVPADCTVLSLGIDHCETDSDTNGGVDGDGDGCEDVTDLVLNA